MMTETAVLTKIPPLPIGGEQFGAWFDATAAGAAVDFFPRYLCHTEAEWAGQPFVLADWQADRIIRPLFGWKRADGSRLIRTVYLEVPRKNGKTELAAGVSLIALMADGEFGGQVYSMACDKEQAEIVFEKAGVMVGMNDSLSRNLDVFKTSIYCASLMAKFKPLSSAPKTKHGFHPTAAIADEIHEWPDGDLYQVVHDGEAGRRQPIEMLITTAGISGQGFGWEMHEYALKVKNGIVEDPSFLPVIFGGQRDDDADDAWMQEETWIRANPNYGISPKAAFIRQQCQRAQGNPRLENNFKRYHLNWWTSQATRWVAMEKWDACVNEPMTLTDLVGRRCAGGLDLSSTTDLTALVLAFDRDAGGYDLFARFWMPEMGLKDRVKNDQVPYDKWAAAGFITLTEGNVVDYDAIRAEISGCGERADEYDVEVIAEHVDLDELAIDRWNATHITTQLMADDITVVSFGQGFASMSAPAKEWERLVEAGLLNHMGNPVLRWMMSCTEIKSDPADNIKPVKPDRRKSVYRIDGIVAGIMALGRLIVADDNEQLSSALQRRGIVSL